ncbi:biotin/lipoyl-containing protein [Clostridium tunisiense]|uniref:biotin/lipoyl-containing protein n=1 Tax=Clostridium tunisiense TaxID=219748 RepID=UPI0002D86044|nr:biotin/lipoyl-containing protein [Clostridium tunisiense]
MKKYVIKLNGKVYEVEMEEVTGETSAAYEKISTASQNSIQQNSVQQSNAPENNATQSSGSQNAEGEILDAPMPGNIINVAVKVGDTVKKGQLIIVLEAMKMENEIVSPKDGIITSVAVSKGQSVNAGDALVKIS